MTSPDTGQHRRCDNCQLRRGSFICPGCLQETVRENRARVVATFDRAALCLGAVTPILAGRQHAVNTKTPKRRFFDINLPKIIEKQLSTEVSKLEAKADELRSLNASRRQGLKDCRAPLERALGTLPSPESVEQGYQNQRIAIGHRDLELRIERRRAIEILLEQCYKIRRVSSRSGSIVGCVLPDDCSDLHALVHSVQAETAQSVVAALGYVVQVIDMIAGYIQVTLPYPLTFLGAESFVTCEFSGRRTIYALSLSSPNAIFQVGLEYLEKDLMVICRQCGVSLLMVPRCSFLPNLLVLLEAVKLAPARSAPLPAPPSPVILPQDDREHHRDFVVIE